MCGICGWFDLKDGTKRGELEHMHVMLNHRGPDDRGSIVFDDAALGMSRLSVIDLTSGHQPMANEEESRWIVFNGEIYNFCDLRNELKAKGYRFRTHSDTE